MRTIQPTILAAAAPRESAAKIKNGQPYATRYRMPHASSPEGRRIEPNIAAFAASE